MDSQYDASHFTQETDKWVVFVLDFDNLYI